MVQPSTPPPTVLWCAPFKSTPFFFWRRPLLKEPFLSLHFCNDSSLSFFVGILESLFSFPSRDSNLLNYPSIRRECFQSPTKYLSRIKPSFNRQYGSMGGNFWWIFFFLTMMSHYDCYSIYDVNICRYKTSVPRSDRHSVGWLL